MFMCPSFCQNHMQKYSSMSSQSSTEVRWNKCIHSVPWCWDELLGCSRRDIISSSTHIDTTNCWKNRQESTKSSPKAKGQVKSICASQPTNFTSLREYSFVDTSCASSCSVPCVHSVIRSLKLTSRPERRAQNQRATHNNRATMNCKQRNCLGC